MRILITGGFGFVGGRLAEYLAQAGYQIILGTRHSISSPEWLPEAEVAKISWDDESALERSCDGVDVIIHAAGMNAQDCSADPVAALAFNGLATARLVAAASKASVKKFIYLSTAHVYASPLVGTVTEETCPRNLHPYATSHLTGEHAVLSASNRGEFQGIILRLSNAFGAPMHKSVNCWMLLVNDLCKQAVQTQKVMVPRIVLRTSGLQRRNFIAMESVSRAVLHFLSFQNSHLETNLYNVGGASTSSVLEMARCIQARCDFVLGFEPELIVDAPKEIEQVYDFDFRSNRLNKYDFELTSDIDKEIDRLLEYCNREF